MNKNTFLSFVVLIFTVSKCAGQFEGICDGTAVVEIIPHPENCTKYVICILQQPSVIDCPPNLVFNKMTGRCEPGKYVL